MSRKTLFIALRLLTFILVCSMIVSVLLLKHTASHADGPITSNPYNNGFGPPNCTWFAWQHLHDTEGIDFQLAPAAAGWLTDAVQPNAFWSETSNSYVTPQINTQPSEGDIMVLPIQSNFASKSGHVAYVDSEMDAQGNFWVLEQDSFDKNPNPSEWTRYKQDNFYKIDQAENGQERFIHFSNALFVPNLSISAGITVSSSSPVLYQPFSASATITNNGNAPLNLVSLFIAAHGPDGSQVDWFTDHNSTPIQPGESRTITWTTKSFAGKCTTCGGGNYTISVGVHQQLDFTDPFNNTSNLDGWGTWWSALPLLNGSQNPLTVVAPPPIG